MSTPRVSVTGLVIVVISRVLQIVADNAGAGDLNVMDVIAEALKPAMAIIGCLHCRDRVVGDMT